MTELLIQHRSTRRRSAQDPPVRPAPGWVAVCRLDDLEEYWGEAALVGDEQVALFRLPGDQLHAVGNVDPRTRAAVLARGIIGSRGGSPTITSPLHKEVYDLLTGACLSGGEGLRIHAVRCADGVVEVDVAA